jgi:Bifunctional DNA primase/polymerase, N-terminal
MCGPRSNITVLDVDSKDERILADAIDRHGKTSIIARSGSGHFQAWYKHNGERRRIRPDRNVPIDILGTNGYVVGPPSQVTHGDYQFIEGSLDDLHNLPALLNVETAIEKPPVLAYEPAPADWVDMVEGDGRNNELFRLPKPASFSFR